MISADILGVVLAGGASRRLGDDKAALPWRGSTLARRAAAVLGEACGEVVIAGPAKLGGSEFETVADIFAGRGPLGGLHAGLARASGRAVFALACDMPFVDARLVRYLLLASGGRAEGAWAASGEGGVQLLCGVYAPACLAIAEARLRAGRLAVGGLFEAVGGTAVPITRELDLYRPELLLNLNRPADLEEARRLQATAEVTR